MRKLLWIIGLLLAVIAAPRASADSFTYYTINFMGPAGTLFPTSGSIVYDNKKKAVNPFTSFTINWDGEVFDFTAAANQFNYLPGTHTLALFDISVPGCVGEKHETGFQPLIVAMVACAPDAIWAAQADVAANTASFSIQFTGGAFRIPYFVELECCTIPPPQVSARPGFDNGGGGLPLSIEDPPPPAVPEPGTGILLCAGIGLAFVLRGRKTRHPALNA
jgi:hypothetical protein